MVDIIIAVVVIVVLIAIAVALWRYRERQTSDNLRSRFGPEYDRAIQQYGDQSKAEEVLAERRDLVEQVTVQPLTATDRNNYAAEWNTIQAQFVDDPGQAVSAADDLIGRVMDRLGYPADALGGREAVASAQYPDVAENYRQAHAIAQKQENGDASTEDLREAMVLYRSLFNQLVGVPSEAPNVSG